MCDEDVQQFSCTPIRDTVALEICDNFYPKFLVKQSYNVF